MRAREHGSSCPLRIGLRPFQGSSLRRNCGLTELNDGAPVALISEDTPFSERFTPSRETCSLPPTPRQVGAQLRQAQEGAEHRSQARAKRPS